MVELTNQELAEMYIKAVDLATNLTKAKPDLFKTTFQCIFWEACHYVFQLKLRESKATKERAAYGLGLPNPNLINPHERESP